MSVLLLALTLAAGCGHRAGLDDYRDFAHRAAQGGLWREALDRWQHADELAHEDPGILNNLAVAHEALGDTLAAQELYEKAVALAPDDDELRGNLLAFRKAHPELYPQEETDEED
ncbi:MAG: tetratricopeptide repeat protein [bacterium]|nr:tetratricopeptide repeat protein [bacterium]